MRFFRVAPLMIAAVLVLGAFGSPDQGTNGGRQSVEQLERASATLAEEHGIRVPDGMRLVGVVAEVVPVTRGDGTVVEVEAKTATFVVESETPLGGVGLQGGGCIFNYYKSYPYVDTSPTGFDFATAWAQGWFTGGGCDEDDRRTWESVLWEKQIIWWERDSDLAAANGAQQGRSLTYVWYECQPDSNQEDWRHEDSIWGNWDRKLVCDG